MSDDSGRDGDARLGSRRTIGYAAGAMRRFGIVFALFGLAYACGGSTDADGNGGASGSGASSGGAGGFGGSGFGGSGGSGGSKDAGKDAKDSGKDADADTGSGGTGGFPTCPDAAPPPPDYQCDPFSPVTGCLAGEACYPWVDYPSGPCEFEQFGTICAPAGVGSQGDPCTGLCAANHVCVITGQGTQCVQLCPLVGADECPSGLFCVPIDVEGFGGCF